jgi:hypothetical protein
VAPMEALEGQTSTFALDLGQCRLGPHDLVLEAGPLGRYPRVDENLVGATSLGLGL